MMKIGFFCYLFFDFQEIADYLALAAVILVTAVLCTLLCRLYYKSRKQHASQPQYFTVYVDKCGRVLRSCENFSANYSSFELFDKLLFCDITIEKRERSRMPVAVSLSDKDGTENYILFYVKNTANGYKLTGEKISQRLSLLLSKVAPIEKQFGFYNTPKFYKDFDLLRQQLQTEDGLLMVIYLNDIFFYKSRFSRCKFDFLQKKLAILFRRHFHEGEIYRMSADSYCMALAGTTKTQRFIDSLPAKLRRLNAEKAVSINGEMVSPEINVGLVRLEEQTKKFTVSQALQCCKNAAAESIVKNTLYEFYVPPSRSRVKNADKLVREIVENKQVDVYFQPQVCLQQNRITGFETLCRIIGENSEKIKVHEFIGHCESQGYIIGLGEFIYHKAFEFAKSVQKFGVSISLNISPHQILEEDFVTRFLDAYSDYRLNPGSISIEITENSLVNSFDKVVQKLEKLHRMGINIHLDDFGIGYSSMLYLKKLPISTIKIDKEFVGDLEQNKFSRVICSKIITIAEELSLNIIAEGVETQFQRQLLSDMRCTQIQGFLISRAVPRQQASELLKEYNSDKPSE